jgi:TolB protein
MKKILTSFLVFFSCCFCVFLCSKVSLAAVSLKIDDQEIKKTKILFIGFDENNPAIKIDVDEIFFLIRKNLKTTDLFEIMKQSSNHNSVANIAKNPVEIGASGIVKDLRANPNLSLINDIETIPDFEKYQKANIEAVIIANFNLDQNNNIEIKIRAWDIFDQRQLFGKFYSASRDNYQKLANLISGEIFKAMTSEKISHFDSQILYVAETGSVKNRVKKIILTDFNAQNFRNITTGSDLVLTPIFSKKPNEIFYLRYIKQGKPHIFSLDLNNLRTSKIGSFDATTFAPSVHPKDQNLLLLSIVNDGNSEIYQMNIATNTALRLTKNSSIDTTPSYSVDGKKIIFISDRENGQQIYLMDVNGDNVKRISFGGGNYSKPAFSPDGKLIAFTKMKDSKFLIGVMLPDGQGEKIISSSYLAEGVKWSPNSRYLIYSKKRAAYGKNSIPRLFIIDVVTGFEFEFPTPENQGATDPDWI